eukprot:EG_transcript_43106
MARKRLLGPKPSIHPPRCYNWSPYPFPLPCFSEPRPAVICMETVSAPWVYGISIPPFWNMPTCDCPSAGSIQAMKRRCKGRFRSVLLGKMKWKQRCLSASDFAFPT